MDLLIPSVTVSSPQEVKTPTLKLLDEILKAFKVLLVFVNLEEQLTDAAVVRVRHTTGVSTRILCPNFFRPTSTKPSMS